MGAPLQVAIVLATTVGAIYAFAREKFPPDVTALLVLLVLVITGVLTPAEGFGGFSHPATIAVAAVLVLSASLERAGAFDFLARRVLAHIGHSELLLGIVLMLTVGALSAFINNTAAVAIFLPIVLETCRRTGARPGQLLLPMSFAAMFGGMSTLIGTSTNVVIHEYARTEGLAGFSMFEFAKLGVPLFAVGFIYLLVARRWLPKGEAPSSDNRRYASRYAVDVFVQNDSSWIGKQIDPAAIRRDHDLELVGIWRAGSALRRKARWPKLMAGDQLRVHGSVKQVMAFVARAGLRVAESPRSARQAAAELITSAGPNGSSNRGSNSSSSASLNGGSNGSNGGSGGKSNGAFSGRSILGFKGASILGFKGASILGFNGAFSGKSILGLSGKSILGLNGKSILGLNGKSNLGSNGKSNLGSNGKSNGNSNGNSNGGSNGGSNRESNDILAEVVLMPSSPAVGHALETVRARGVYASSILGMRRAGRRSATLEAGEKLHAGDALLLQTTPTQLAALREDPAALVMRARPKPEVRPGRLAISVAILAGVVLTAAVGLLPIVTAASAGCLLLMITGTLRPREAYESINWQVVFMLAGVLALGTAMQKTGIAAFLAHGLTFVSRNLGPVVAVSMLYVLTAVLTQFVSNTASAALLVPVALDAAELLAVRPEPFLIAVTFAASAAFATPIGYQTNLMVLGPGGYRFADFMRLGLPLSVLFWLMATIAIPLVWPFGG